MRVKLAYLGVVLVWATTPLGIKWSGEGLSFVFGVTARMTIGALCLALLMLLIRQRLAFHSAARWTYLAVTTQLYVGMIITYWSAQFIPSGWLSVIFGLCPVMTAFLAANALNEQSLGWQKLSAYFLGFCGLIVMFISAVELSRQALMGIAGVLLSTFIQSASAIWIKRINAKLPALQQISGGLLFSLPLYFLSWYWLDNGQIPTVISDKSLYAIIYLGTIATTLGFIMYFFVLTHLPATKVALINLITPVFSLLLGCSINQEPLTIKVAIGASLIIMALLILQLAERHKVKSVKI
jgi:drug/metabolite transporter (DMT)-like permease